MPMIVREEGSVIGQTKGVEATVMVVAMSIGTQ